jgi:hypothetical protein
MGEMGETGTLEYSWKGVDVAGCLSPHHIRSQNMTIPAKVVFYPKASLVTAVRELQVKKCVVCGEEFKVERYRADKFSDCVSCRRGEVTWKRGEVTRFSESSRLRLMRLLNMVRNDIRPLFVTLTYPDEFGERYQEPEVWKRDIRAFEHRFRRAFPGCSFVWRLEVVDRKSGEFVGKFFPHFHLLVFGVKLREMREFVPVNWNEIAGYGSEEHFRVHSHRKTVTPVLSRRGVMRYAGKTVGAVMSSELAKELQAKGKHVGRWWGVIVRDVFKERFLDVAEELEVWDKDAVTLLRYFRRIIGLEGFSLRSLTVFLNGGWLERNLLKMLSPPGEGWFKVTGRKYNEPFWQYAYRKGMWEPVLEGNGEPGTV